MPQPPDPDPPRCAIYRCGRRAETYLYVALVDGEPDLSRLPEGLLDSLGRREHVMDLELPPGRRLARVDRDEVVAALAEQGFFLQLPPPLTDP